jgi:hypothetical protein
VKTTPELSSSLTFFHKFLLPVGFIAALPAWLQLALRSGGYEWIPAIGWLVACGVLLVWSRSIERVSVDGNSFLISNYITTHRVPISHFHGISERRHNRTPTIVLHFDPPTPFGRSIRIIPPGQMFGASRFDKAASFLKSLIDEHQLNAA